MLRKARIAAIFAFSGVVSCAAAAPRSSEDRAPFSSLSATPAPSAPEPVTTAPMPSASEPETQTSAPSEEALRAETADERLVIETPYRPGAYPWPRDADERRARIQELYAWNQGGLGSDRKWHPQPRVVVSEPLVVSGKIDARGAMRELRAEQYGAIRRCYDERLRDDPKLEGRTVLALDVRRDGSLSASIATARDARRLPDERRFPHAMRDREVTRCLAKALRAAHVPRPRGKRARLLVSIDLWPGDAPIPDTTAEPREGRVDPERTRVAVVAIAERLRGCFVDAARTAPELWGRLAMRLDVDASGTVTDAAEIETTFPSPEATRCALEAVRTLRLEPPTPAGHDARVVVAVRWKSEGATAKPQTPLAEPTEADP